MDETDLTNAILYASSARGIYIPQFFAESVIRENVQGVPEEDWAILEAGPDHEWYWEAWNDVCDNALLVSPDTAAQYRLWQDGDLWLIPEEDIEGVDLQ
jgi:hypothetical protein